MKRNQIERKKRYATPILITLALLSLILFLSSRRTKPSTSTRHPNLPVSVGDPTELPRPARLAYLITGTRGDAPRVRRLLQAVYHPRNQYVVHLDLDAPDEERMEVARYVKAEERVVREVGNVVVVGEADLVTVKGPTAVASVLHAVAVLLQRGVEWDWFVNLSAEDYPLMPQDDILHIFSYLPKDLNFLEHTSNIGWKEYQRARPIIIDPGLYHMIKSGVFWAKEKRSLPASFKLFVGSEWMVLSKSFLEFCIWGWDNLPRTLLMYYANFLSSTEGYFHTVVCNHKDYQNTTVNHDLHYTKWDNPPKQNPVSLTVEHFQDMVQSGAPFARKFAKDNSVLDKIDQELLRRSPQRFTPGGWCLGNVNSASSKDPCALYGDANAIKPSASSKRLEKLIVKLLDSENFRPKQCK